MKLLYVYIENWPPFRGTELQFDSNYRFALKSGRESHVLCIERREIIPNGFFASGYQAKGVTTSVSAVVGVNGSGKTTLADLIRRVLTGETIKGDYVVAFEVGGELFVKYRFSAQKPCDHGCRLEVEWKRKGRWVYLLGSGRKTSSAAEQLWKSYDINYLYLSPFYTTERTVGGDGRSTFDYSTTKLIKESVEERPDDPLGWYNAQEKTRVMKMIRGFYLLKRRYKSSQMLVLRTSGICLQFRFSSFLDRLESYESVQEKIGVVNGLSDVKSLLRIVGRRRYGRKHVDDFPLRFFVCVACGVFLQHVKNAYMLGMMVEDEVSKSEDEILFGMILETIEQLKKEKEYLKKVEVANDLLTRFHSLTSDVGHAYSLLFNALQEALRRGVNANRDGIYFNFETMESAAETILDAVRDNALLQEDMRVFDCDIFPRLSSGEISFLSYWGRIYEFLEKKQWLDDRSHQLILFLDEIETAMHPEWQLRLVWDTLRFLETFARNISAHVIFASHSPLLLSDVPKDNVCFLPIRRHASVNRMVDKAWRRRLSEMDNTFASDIFDLYRIPFFLHGGTIGAFARKKIENVLERNGEVGKTKAKRRKQVISLIGDQFIRGCVRAEVGRR